MRQRVEDRGAAEGESMLLVQPDLGGGQAGVPGYEAVVPAHAAPGDAPGEEGAGATDTARGALYDGPERRRHQEDWGTWRDADRRTRPFLYARDQQV
jgi:hypothetical protein